jgi:hypothetical protein
MALSSDFLLDATIQRFFCWMALSSDFLLDKKACTIHRRWMGKNKTANNIDGPSLKLQKTQERARYILLKREIY